MTDKEFDDFLDSCYQELEDKQALLLKNYNIGKYDNYFFNQATGTIQFKNAEKVELEFIAVPAGSWSCKSNTWMWAWANKSLTEELKAQSMIFKGLAEYTGFGVFEKEVFEADEAMAHEITSMAVHYTDAMGMYIVPSEGLKTFLVLIKNMTEVEFTSFETEFRNILICLAEGRIDLPTWTQWWKTNSAEVKKIISPGDFSRINRAPSSYGPDTYMLKCQCGAEEYLTKMGIPFQDSNIYLTGSEEECRLYQERIEQQRILEQEEQKKSEEQKRRDVEELSDYKLLINRQSGIRTLPVGAKNSEILKLLAEWTELLARQEYAGALGMFQFYNFELEWTPELLESAVYGFGCPGYTREEAEKIFGTSDCAVTSLWENPDRECILRSIDIKYYTLTEESAALRGLLDRDYENIIGDVHYFGVPINGEASDFTARFEIKKVENDKFTLVFNDMHML